MPLPNGSIANLSVTRKTLKGSNDKKLHRRAFGSPSRVDSRGFAGACVGNAAMTGIVRRHENKNAGAFEGAGVRSTRFIFAAPAAATRAPDYF